MSDPDQTNWFLLRHEDCILQQKRRTPSARLPCARPTGTGVRFGSAETSSQVAAPRLSTARAMPRHGPVRATPSGRLRWTSCAALPSDDSNPLPFFSPIPLLNLRESVSTAPIKREFPKLPEEDEGDSSSRLYSSRSSPRKTKAVAPPGSTFPLQTAKKRNGESRP